MMVLRFHVLIGGPRWKCPVNHVLNTVPGFRLGGRHFTEENAEMLKFGGFSCPVLV
jgi:hypothetical protein